MIESTHRSRDEAIAAGLAQSQPGDTLTIHEEWCACNGTDDELACDCEPLVLVIGAKA